MTSKETYGLNSQQSPLVLLTIKYDKSYNKILSASTLKNANVKCKENLIFQVPKCSVSGNAKPKYCKFFCNTATM